MQAIQLDLFTGQSIAMPAAQIEEIENSYFGDGILNPCINCDLKEWCSDDDCGQHLYDLDTNEPEDEKYSFTDWLSMPLTDFD